MTINDQIGDEKLQYDINREAAKISSLSSCKIRKYEYLTGEDILPLNQQQIIEQARFNYSPLGKTLERQIKTIEGQGEKQIKAIQNQRQDKMIKKYTYDLEDTPFISKQKEIFNKLIDERYEKINDLDEKVNSDDLIYRYKGNTADENFDKFDNAINIINKIQNGEIELADVKRNQEKLKKYLGQIKKGGKKTKEQKNTLFDIEALYKARNEAIEFYDDYSLMMSEGKTKARATEGKGLKMLTPKQMIQRLPIALAQVKAGNNSENLLNEIRQIVYSLCQSKEITKKVYNNIIKSL